MDGQRDGGLSGTCFYWKTDYKRLILEMRKEPRWETKKGIKMKTRHLSTRLTEHKWATRNGDVNNHIAEHHLQTKHRIGWDSATCTTYSTDYYQRLTLESWFTNFEQTPLNRGQQLPAPYKRLIDEINCLTVTIDESKRNNYWLRVVIANNITALLTDDQ